MPAAYLVIERCVESAVVYGARKSLFFATQQSKENYNMAKDLIAGTNANASKMAEVAALLDQVLKPTAA